MKILHLVELENVGDKNGVATAHFRVAKRDRATAQQHMRHGLANSVSLHPFWCCDTRGRLGCRNTGSSVTNGKPHCGLKLCRDTVFDVATRFGPFGVMT